MTIEKARELHDSGNYEQAINIYNHLVNETEDSKTKAIFYLEMAWAYYKWGKYEQAIVCINAVLQTDSEFKNKEEIYRIKAFSYIALNELELAEKFLLKSLEIERSSEKQQISIFELGKIYFKNCKYQQSLEVFKEVEGYFYQNKKEYWLTLLFYKGFAQYYLKDFTDSEKTFEELLENTEDKKRQAGALFGLAFLTFDKKDYLKTINLCETVIAYDNEFFDLETVGFMVATSFHYLGRDDVFTQYALELTKKYPDGKYTGEIKKLLSVKNKSKN